MSTLKKPRYSQGYATCMMCSNHARPEYYNETKIFICHDCAEIVANTFNYVHFCRWLTWENEKKNKKKTIANGLRKKVFERDMYRCVKCNSHQDLCCDHIYPESKGGETVFENLQTLCRSCNSKKGTKVEEQE